VFLGHGYSLFISGCSVVSQALAREVSSSMASAENSNRVQNRLSCCGLYLHFFLSIVAILECVARLLYHLAVLCIIGMFYYLIYCLSCGEMTAETGLCLAHHSAMYGLYSGLLCGLCANIGMCIVFDRYHFLTMLTANHI
jgi:hypothetical protein